MPDQPEYVTVQLTHEAREVIRRHQLAYSAKVERRLTMAETVIAAFELADQHTHELPSVPIIARQKGNAS